ncbi:MAG: M24 family metallopeptidase [Candidatus Xenobiia bacterium LiM19]
MSKELLKEKITQAFDVLKEKNIDLWLTFVRESSTIKDPALDLILGTSVTWQSAFMISSKGKAEALVGSLDKANISSTGLYDEVTGYVASIREPLIEMLQKFQPASIAINTSKDDIMSDGLTHGMYELLISYLEGTPFKERLVSSQPVLSALRGRKTPGELASIQKAISITVEIFDAITAMVHPGLTEKDIAEFVKGELLSRGIPPSWDPGYCPSVFTGPESAGAHAAPTDRVVEKGHLLNMDFGVKTEDYCSDLQRTWYFLRDDEETPPPEVIKAFEAVRDGITKASEALKPGLEGWMADDITRSHITSLGFEEFPHGLGHQVGRSTHDGAGLLCPRWERYGSLPYLTLEEGQVYTLEPRVTLPGYGVATIEEMVVITRDGCRFLSPRQAAIYTVR